MQDEGGNEQQKIEALEQCLEQTCQGLNKVYAFNQELLEQQMQRFNSERMSMLEQIESLTFKLAESEKSKQHVEAKVNAFRQQTLALECELEQARHVASQRENEIQKHMSLAEKYKAKLNQLECELHKKDTEMENVEERLQAKKIKAKKWKELYRGQMQE